MLALSWNSLAMLCIGAAMSLSNGSAYAASGSDVPARDEEVCLRAVTQQTNNPDVVLLGSEFSQANNTVMVGVGPQKAKWRCLVKDGIVAEVMSLTDEGAL